MEQLLKATKVLADILYLQKKWILFLRLVINPLLANFVLGVLFTSIIEVTEE